MPSRVEKHGQEQTTEKRRTHKNQTLYQDMKNYAMYQEVENIEPVIETENFSFKDIHKEPVKRRRSVSKESIATDTLSSLLMMQEKREYDINKVLKDAKETRGEKDSLEEKRSLKKKEYNIVNEIDLDKLDEIKEKRKNSGVKEAEDEELKEIIDTIYSKKLKEDIEEAEIKLAEEQNEDSEKDLFSELLPSSTEETIISENLSREIVEEEKKNQSKKIENSFFTSSMDLSLDDMIEEVEVEDDEDEKFFDDETRLPVWSIILIVVGVLVTIGVIIYFLSTAFM